MAQSSPPPPPSNPFVQPWYLKRIAKLQEQRKARANAGDTLYPDESLFAVDAVDHYCGLLPRYDAATLHSLKQTMQEFSGTPLYGLFAKHIADREASATRPSTQKF